MKQMVNNMGKSVSATELAKLGKCEMLITPNRERGEWFRFRKPTDSADSVATKRGEAAHKRFEQEATRFANTVQCTPETKWANRLLAASVAAGVLILILAALSA
ncbi:MAG: hypothetical protein SWN10_13375 [Pseudomonadota bacterium]|nr:hypothetical protein [Pseudomonadota bacterium]